MAKDSTNYFDSPGSVLSNDPTHFYTPIEYTKEDVAIIRELAQEYMSYATLPIQAETIKCWERVNDLERTRPVVWYNDLPWHEMNVNDELTLRTSTKFTQIIETELRRRIYLWKHMPGDMVLEPVFYSPIIINNTGIGLNPNEEVSLTDEDNNIYGHKFIPALRTMDDIEKIVEPVITVDKELTQKTLEAHQDILGDIIPVQLKGPQGFFFCPMDHLVMLMGTGEILMNLVLQPELIHASMKRLMEVSMSALDQYENLGLLGSNNLNYRIGSGAYGYTSTLSKGQGSGMKTNQMWAGVASQYFTTVSPEMHEEFSLQYELEWLNRFAYSYYGCCEKLDHKVDILRQVKNLRKISCSPWTNVAHMAEVVGRDYVVSLKPNPACFVFDKFDEDVFRKDLESKLDLLKDCNVEVLMKDISTIKYDPPRLWRCIELITEIIGK